MIGCSPAALRLDVPELRVKIAAIRPAAHGISPRTFANLRSLFAAAMEWAGVIEHCPRGAAKQDPAWAPLAAAIAGDKRLANGLAAFMNWCARTGVEPVIGGRRHPAALPAVAEDQDASSVVRATLCSRSRRFGRMRGPSFPVGRLRS